MSTATVHVSNLPYDTSEDVLTQFFGQAGPVVSFKIVLDRETGRQQGFGFCTFREASAASAAVQMFNGRDFGGRPLTVQLSREQTRNTASNVPVTASSISAAADQSKLSVASQVSSSQSAQQMITDLVRGLKRDEASQILAELKRMSQASPEQTRALLGRFFLG